jgi:hypothetical protein
MLAGCTHFARTKNKQDSRHIGRFHFHGAILSRNKKSKLMGVGYWKGKQDWPEQVKWMKVVTEMKPFVF